MSFGGCSLCPGGAAPLYPDVSIAFADGTAYTCRELADLLPLVTDQITCLSVQYSASGYCCETSWSDVCDPTSDPCPLSGDKLCKSLSQELDPQGLCISPTSDCFDCDPCSGASYTSCEACVSAENNDGRGGCYWCPGDAKCLLNPYSTYPHPLLGSVLGSCASASDWLATCPTSNTNPYSDPLYDADSWAFEMINVRSVWERGITGAGVRIRVNDNGVDASHAELSGKFAAAASCDSYLPADAAADKHGTACASIAAGSGDNGACSVGVAPGATVSSCNVFDRAVQSDETYRQLTVALSSQDVSSNSYVRQSCKARPAEGRRGLQSGGCPFLPDAAGSPCSACSDFGSEPLDRACADAIVAYCSFLFNYEADPACVDYLELFAACQYNGINPQVQRQLSLGASEGRNGLGLIFVFASGNDQADGADANYQGFYNSRFVITVGAVGKDGRHSAYSTPGASLLLSAPGGDFEFGSSWITAEAGTTDGCFDIGVGTSFATPAVSGVVALVLQANPNLGWRDVQGIFANTSQILASAADDDSWVTNAAGLTHSNKYGFGVVDAAAAVAAAATWQNYGPERVLSAFSGEINLPIDDSSNTTITSVLDINGIMTLESVVVYVDLESSSRGYLLITLTSPSGTESILTPGYRPENTQLRESVRMKLTTLKSWGESSGGDWTLTISTTKPAEDVSTCVDLPSQDDTVTCYSLPALLEANNMTAEDACNESSEIAAACCFCGGGESASSIRDQLSSWSLILYGHDLIGNLAPTLSPAPTFSYGQSPAEPTVNAPTVGTPRPTNFLLRNPTNAPTVQSVTGPSSGSLDCVTESNSVRDCLGDGINECSQCMLEALSGLSDDVSCSTLENVACAAFSSQCDSLCGSCDQPYLQYMSCATGELITGGCELDCNNSTNAGGATPSPVLTSASPAAGGAPTFAPGAPIPAPAPTSSSHELKFEWVVFMPLLVLAVL